MKQELVETGYEWHVGIPAPALKLVHASLGPYHSITEWFGLEVLKLILFRSPCQRQGQLPLEQIAPSLIQPGHELLQG